MCHIALQIEQIGSDLGDRGNSGRHHRDLGRADQSADVLTVEQYDLLLAIIECQRHLDLGQHRDDMLLILSDQSASKSRQTDGAVQSAGIHINIAEFLRGKTRDGRFSGARGAVDSNSDRHSVLLRNSLFVIAKPEAFHREGDDNIDRHAVAILPG